MYYNHEHYPDPTAGEALARIEREERRERRRRQLEMAREFAKEFYKSQAWRRARAAYIAQRESIDGGRCELCQDEPGVEVHHRIFLRPENIHDKNITLNPDNFELLCYNCHQMRHESARKAAYLKAKQRDGESPVLKSGMYYYDDEGNLQPFKAYMVWGPPGSGKTTYVRQHIQQGDVAIDLDLIGRALSMADKADVPRNVERIALDIRDFLYEQIERRQLNAKRVWVIASLPKYKHRHEVADRLKAELIQIEASFEECYQRILHDDERKDKALQLSIIEKWFKDYEPESAPPLSEK